MLNLPGLVLDEEEIKNLCLASLEELFRNNGTSLSEFGEMPQLSEVYASDLTNLLIRQELLYDRGTLLKEHDTLSKSLTGEQHLIYDTILNAPQLKNGGVFFVYGYGGTGNTFLWRTLIAALRSRGSDLASLIRKTKLIIWDESPMIHKHCFEAFDRYLKDILRSSNPNSENQPFGGNVVVFGGDFRQILPVIPKGSRSDIVNASLNSSALWHHVRVLKLTVNMRLNVGSDQDNVDEVRSFGEWILKLGDGLLGEENDGEVEISIPQDLLIDDKLNPVKSLVDFTYPNILVNASDPTYFQQRAILAPTHSLVNSINEKLLDTMNGDETIYYSSDSLCETEQTSDVASALFSADVLNNLQFSGLPNHRLVLKVGCPIMLLRNIDQSNGLCNGTRLIVVKLGKNVIEAKVITGSNIGHTTLISRLKMAPSDKRILVKICRKQFPKAVCFAMTINKSQGQSFDHVGISLPRPVFSHGQLYVAVSRVKNKKGLKIPSFDKGQNVSNKTTNVVYKEVLQHL